MIVAKVSGFARKRGHTPGSASAMPKQLFVLCWHGHAFNTMWMRPSTAMRHADIVVEQGREDGLHSRVMWINA